MLYLKKAYVWCVQYWRWLVFGLVGLIAYLAGKKSSKNLLRQAELAKDHYRKESAKIESLHKEERKALLAAEEKYNASLLKLEEKYDDKNSMLKRSKDKEYKQMLKAAKKDSKALSSLLRELGIEEV